MSEFHSEISKLSPAPVWQFFDKICSIPHPSKHEEALAQYIIGWAKEQGLDVRRDPTGNVFIKKPATPGMEHKKAVVLQAHIDMVPQKNEDTDHDFAKDPIQPYIDGEWVTAKGTTLGADNGIGMATCLAVLASTEIKHGPLEVLLTIDEEAGMTGAFGLEAGWLEGEILLNTDSEQEGEVYMGCAGGVDGALTFDIQREALPAGYVTRQLTLKGLKGGHSGCDIHTGRGNANKLIARFLAGHAQELDLRLIEFRGGSLRNAIPREAFVTVAIPADNQTKLDELFTTYTELLKAELGRVETNLVTFNEAKEAALGVFALADQQRVIAALNACPNGVIRMSDDIEGVVETSLNVGVITTDEQQIKVLCLIRSLIDSGRSQVESMLTSVAELAGADIVFSGAYPGWKPDADSEIMHIFRDMYEGIYGHKPNIMVIHAGLECGLFKKPYPEMDMVSFGPTIKFPHSPDEKVKIDTVGLFWEQMIALLENIPAKV
ncbi:aminoacyl-histidine dipeptidase [Vibrio fluvialis]|uniref:aminoacyl-histidine dipeptidase n=1 Tax=Vibrio fluvialis TaxID=676 RepID=UPI00192A7E62|nr:aminoacyl-histidine dipeptidase [Vibrio fluvialis]HDM8034667.1 aminoacyl-histidine dipeptidase [Vibrio fluvialis clinical-1]EKO3414334.1 aminoacyl-histidine dipeptidase [Vibrio fluvialis]EKO3415221.1 aminoacyl-histidine dipeptidase [Vibrio fluvialis]EKO3422904.1 aminoacyl-histidine dipeptidase [Vibrio fluvialis]EKO3523962.1 aminoacyl-histidine dipeptidase [Vibrio fluvialis]